MTKVSLWRLRSRLSEIDKKLRNLRDSRKLTLITTLPAGVRNIMINTSLCLFVCLSVCLSVCPLVYLNEKLSWVSNGLNQKDQGNTGQE